MSPEWQGEGIDPRFTLANERTFLAWTRTGISLVAAGLAFTELLPRLGEHGTRRLLGIPLMLIGAFIAYSADKHRAKVQTSLVAGKGVPDSYLPHLLTTTVVIFALVSAALLF